MYNVKLKKRWAISFQALKKCISKHYIWKVHTQCIYRSTTTNDLNPLIGKYSWLIQKIHGCVHRPNFWIVKMPIEWESYNLPQHNVPLVPPKESLPCATLYIWRQNVKLYALKSKTECHLYWSSRWVNQWIDTISHCPWFLSQLLVER